MLAKKYERICLTTCVFKKIDVSLHAVSERWKVAKDGKLPEWSNGPHSKCGVRVTVPGVRIPHFPQNTDRCQVCRYFLLCVITYMRSATAYIDREQTIVARHGYVEPKLDESNGRKRKQDAESDWIANELTTFSTTTPKPRLCHAL